MGAKLNRNITSEKKKKEHICNNTSPRDKIKTSPAKYYFRAVKGSSLPISRDIFDLASIALQQRIWGRTEAQRLVDDGGPAQHLTFTETFFFVTAPGFTFELEYNCAKVTDVSWSTTSLCGGLLKYVIYISSF